MKTIFGVEDIVLIDEDGSPCGQKVKSLLPCFDSALANPHILQEYLVWNPPYIDENDLKQGRISTIQETSRIFRFLMQRGIRVIVFCRVSQIYLSELSVADICNRRFGRNARS